MTQDSVNSNLATDEVESAGMLSRAGVTLIGSAVGAVVVFLNAILAARYLGAQIFGLFGLAIILAKLCETISVFGLHFGILHYLPIYRAEGRMRRVLGTIVSSLILPALIALILAPVVWFAAPWLANEVFDEPSGAIYIQMLALSIPFLSLSEILGFITRGYGFVIYYVLIRNLVAPLSLLVFLVLLMTLEADPLWITAAFGGSYVLAFLVGAVCLRRATGGDLWRQPADFNFRELYVYSFPILINTILYLIIGASDILMLGMFRGADEVGVYRAGMQMVVLFNLIVVAFSAATATTFPVLVHGQRWRELGQTFTTATKWMTMLTLPLYVIMVHNAHDIMGLMGAEFTVGATALVLLASSAALTSCFGCAGFLLVIGGRQITETVNAGVIAAVNILLNLILIPRYGIVGAAVATGVSISVMNIVRLVEIRVLMRLSPVNWNLLKVVLLAGVVAALIAFGVEQLGIGNGNGIGLLLLRVSVTGGVFLVAYWFFAMDQSDRALVKKGLAALGRASNGK